jgi:hypothetical protein
MEKKLINNILKETIKKIKSTLTSTLTVLTNETLKTNKTENKNIKMTAKNTLQHDS